mgnify:CR=1 FL=1
MGRADQHTFVHISTKKLNQWIDFFDEKIDYISNENTCRVIGTFPDGTVVKYILQDEEIWVQFDSFDEVIDVPFENGEGLLEPIEAKLQGSGLYICQLVPYKD